MCLSTSHCLAGHNPMRNYLAVLLTLALASCSAFNVNRESEDIIRVEVEGTITKLVVECGADYAHSFGAETNLIRGE